MEYERQPFACNKVVMIWMEQAVSVFWHELQGGRIAELPPQIYVLLGVFAALEGPITTLIGAAAASTGLLHPGLVFLSAATGNLAGDIFWYCLGFFGENIWRVRLSRWLRMRAGWVEGISLGMEKHSATVLFFAKLTNSITVPSLITAGLLRVKLRDWFPAILGAEILWTGMLMCIGYFSAESIPFIKSGLKFYPFAALFLFVIALLVFLRTKLKHSRLCDQPSPAEHPSKDPT